MDADTLRKAIDILGWKSKGNWDSRNVHVGCPFASLYHKSGTDNNPSMAVKIVPDGPSPAICNTCQTRGLFVTVVRQAYEAGLVSHSGFSEVSALEIGSWSGQHTKSRRDKKKTWRSSLGVITSGRVAQYILDRGISKATCRAWNLSFDTKRNRTVFPVYNLKCKRVGLFGRESSDQADVRYPAYPGWDPSLYLYGEHLVRERTGPLLLVEGPLDVLWLWQEAPYPVVGLLGLHLSAERISKLRQLTDELVLFLDNDFAGQRMLERVHSSLFGRFPRGVWTVAYGSAKCRTDRTRRAKDPCELTPKRIERMVSQRSFFC